jgi:putative tricarboxylic transport membrane protein
MRKRDFYVSLFWVALGIFVSAYAYTKLGIGKFNTPGSGLMPFILGVLFGLIALYKVVVALLTHSNMPDETTAEGEADGQPVDYKKLAFVMVAMFLYAILLEPLGFLVSTFLTMIILFRSAGFTRWWVAAAYSGTVVLITFFLFTYLGVRFPPGILRPLGLN